MAAGAGAVGDAECAAKTAVCDDASGRSCDPSLVGALPTQCGAAGPDCLPCGGTSLTNMADCTLNNGGAGPRGPNTPCSNPRGTDPATPPGYDDHGFSEL